MKNEFEIRIANSKAQIYTPYNAQFVSKVKLLGARWNADNRCWTVAEEAVSDVREAMRAIYGRDDQPVAETVDVILHFSENIYEYSAGITLLGRTIARAFGRDSGAKVGDNVMFLEGEPESGGSSKHWTTVIPAGSVVKILGVPSTMTGANLPDGVTMEIATERVDREALEQEKARLLARLAEIENLLK